MSVAMSKTMIVQLDGKANDEAQSCLDAIHAYGEASQDVWKAIEQGRRVPGGPLDTVHIHGVEDSHVGPLTAMIRGVSGLADVKIALHQDRLGRSDTPSGP